MKIITLLQRNFLRFMLFSLAFLSACSNPLSGIPYRIDIDQGNQITQAQVNQLSVGMNKEEVQFLLGTPLLNDIFNEDRWDYLQYHKVGSSKEVRESVLTLYFKNNLLVQIDADKFIGASTGDEPTTESHPQPKDDTKTEEK